MPRPSSSPSNEAAGRIATILAARVRVLKRSSSRHDRVGDRGTPAQHRFERARREGGPLHAIQSWVALPESDEEAEPAFDKERIAQAKADWKAGRMKLPDGDNEEYIPLPPDPVAPPPAMS